LITLTKFPWSRQQLIAGNQMIGFLREANPGLLVSDLCHGRVFLKADYHLGRNKFGDISVPDAMWIEGWKSKAAGSKVCKPMPCWRTR
jgi:hypothetical protein